MINMIDFSKYPDNIVVISNSERTIDLDLVGFDEVKMALRKAKLEPSHLKEVSKEAIRKIVNYYPELGI